MLTKLICRNFKCFEEVEIELGNPVVFIGPNNSGKTTALQSLALWDIGLKRWNEKWKGQTNPEKRRGVTINRRDLISVPVPDAKLLWKNLRVQAANRPGGRNICIDIIVEGVTAGKKWKCGLEFYYANPESFYCRPLRLSETERPVPDEAAQLDVAFLPPMSGLASNETRLDPGAINVRIGEGRTAEVLRNLCYQVSVEQQDGKTWKTICEQIDKLFGVQLEKPDYILERGEIAMRYKDRGISLDLSSSGRGLQQTLLLLAYIAAHPGSVLLLDEPDAHLEILRQRQIYQMLTELATKHNSQIVAASHSEVILNEAANRENVIIAFLGKPHCINNRGNQLLKSLREFGFEHYYKAEQRGWVLYLEGSTDLDILKAFADKLDHPAKNVLENPYVEYVVDQPQRARNHFRALREAKPDLVGFCLFDRLDRKLQDTPELREYAWKRREIENYIVDRKEVLIHWAQEESKQWPEGPLFSQVSVSTMKKAIEDIENAFRTLGEDSPWSSNTRVSTDFLDRLFKNFFNKLALPNFMRKTNYHRLVHYVPRDAIDPEVSEVLDRILAVAEQAVPLT